MGKKRAIERELSPAPRRSPSVDVEAGLITTSPSANDLTPWQMEIQAEVAKIQALTMSLGAKIAAGAPRSVVAPLMANLSAAQTAVESASVNRTAPPSKSVNRPRRQLPSLSPAPPNESENEEGENEEGVMDLVKPGVTYSVRHGIGGVRGGGKVRLSFDVSPACYRAISSLGEIVEWSKVNRKDVSLIHHSANTKDRVDGADATKDGTIIIGYMGPTHAAGQVREPPTHQVALFSDTSASDVSDS
jgi:hypothetical protein